MEKDYRVEKYSRDYPGDMDLSFRSVGSSTITWSGRSSSFSRASSSVGGGDAEGRRDGEGSKAPRPHQRQHPSWSSIQTATNLSNDGVLHLHHLKLIRQLGSGDVGRVFLCRLRSDPNAHFALKVVDRNSLSPNKIGNADTEAKILSTLDHPFLPTLYSQINASHYTCLLIDYCSRGDLNALLRAQPKRTLPLHALKFYASELLLALEYLHSKGIVYRDLKPENILIRQNGHLMLSDFDLCFTSHVTPRIHRDSFVAEPTSAYSRSFVGTHEYLAPELVNGNGYGNGIDWWAFGVLLYELMYGTTPFKGRTKDSTLRNIASETRNVRFPEKGEPELRDLIQRLLVKDPKRRLGGERGAADIKTHPFFEGVKWPLIRSYPPPEIVRGVVSRKKSRRMGFSRALRYLLNKTKGSSSSNNSTHGNRYYYF